MHKPATEETDILHRDGFIPHVRAIE